MTSARNGGGGEVQFGGYSRWSDSAAGRSRTFTHTVADICPGENGWEPLSGSLDCPKATRFEITGQAWRDVPIGMLQPGGHYRFVLPSVDANGPAVRIRFGFDPDGMGPAPPVFSSWQDLPDEARIRVTGKLTLPTAASAEARMIVECREPAGSSGSCVLREQIDLERLLTRYRVTEKAFLELNTGARVAYDYAYTGAKSNGDPGAPETHYEEKHSVFYGHRTVTETGPDGLQTATTFHQADLGTVYLGQVERLEVLDGATLVRQVDYEYAVNGNGYSVVLIHPTNESGYIFSDLRVQWIRPIVETIGVCESPGACVTTRTRFAYVKADQDGGQYGNPTRVYEEWLSQSGWQTYRASWSQFTPNQTASLYLVGLPGFSNRYDCAGGCDFADPGSLLGSTWFLYDGEGLSGGTPDYAAPPTAGVLTGLRELVCFADPAGECRVAYSSGNPGLYRDTQFSIDSWGNQTAVSEYRSPGTETSYAWNRPAADPRTTTTVYDPPFHSYPTAVINPLGQETNYTYDPNHGQVATVTGPNGPNTTVETRYDGFGRVAAIILPGDSAADPTRSFTYQPYSGPGSYTWVAMRQKLNSENGVVVRKFYDGLGRLVEQQVVGAALEGEACREDCTVVQDRLYDTAGRPWKESIPWVVGGDPGGYVTPGGQSGHYTETQYDSRGRVSAVIAPNGLAVTTTYGFGGAAGRFWSQQAQEDSWTRSYIDPWGRVVEVRTPAAPFLFYAYDAANRRTAVIQGESPESDLVTTSVYDIGGRLRQYSDPDRGTWTYAYDVLGDLTRQTDARGQRVCRYYDPLRRLVGVHARPDDHCPAGRFRQL